MVRYFLPVFVALSSIFIASVLSAQPTGERCQELSFVMPSGEHQLFRLAFEDRFEGRQLDKSKWKVNTGVPRDPEQKFQHHYYLEENLEVSDSTLKIWIRRDSMPNKDFRIWMDGGMKDMTGDFPYTSGEIVSTEEFGYGMYEIRCKLPHGKGMWPAFWVYGEPDGRYNELDVFEYWNEDAFLKPYAPKKLSRVQNMTVHFDGQMSKGKSKGPVASEGFHTYTLIWNDCKILWYRDGQLERAHFRYKGVRETDPDCSRGLDRKNPKLNVFPIDEGLRILANVAVQSRDESPEPDTEFPQAMEVDFIRYYEWAEE